MQTEEKTAIIVIGGGMRSAYGAGFLYAIGNVSGLRKPDIVVASSGATGGAFYFLAEQYEDIRRIWCEALPSRRFISWLRRPIMDIDYLVDEIFRRESPLNTDLLARSPTRYCVPLLETTQESIRMICKESGADPYELMRASKSMPFFFGKSTPLLGGWYMDGGIAVVRDDMILFAREQGATRILVINNRSILNPFKRLLLSVYARTIATKAYRRALMHWMGSSVQSLPSEHCLIVEPHVKMWTATRSPQKVSGLFQAGMRDALALEDKLRTLLTV